MKLFDFHQITGYRISDGTEFLWGCYGLNAFMLSAEVVGSSSISVVFSTATQQVFEMSAYDYANSRAYRWQHPDYCSAYQDEARSRNVAANQAWDDVDFIDLDIEADFIEKATAIAEGREYDTRVQVSLDIDDALLFKVMQLAHERDITTNELVNQILKSAIEEFEK